MDTLIYIAAAGVSAGAAVGFARGAWRRRDAERRAAERVAYRRRQEAERLGREDANVASIVDRYFPFAKAAWERATRVGDARARLSQALSTLEGVVLGAASIGFPAVLALQERLKHLLILGRTGGGKTTILLRLLAKDLARPISVVVLGSESEFFRDWGLGLVPESRINDVVYLRPASPDCGLVWNPLVVPPGVDRAVAAGQYYTALKRALGEVEIGARADAILASAVAVMASRPDVSLLTLVRFLEDDVYRASVIEGVDDPYLHSFWTKTAAEFPAGAVLPIVTRLNRFLRVPQVRAALCHPISTVSLHEALENAGILFLDSGGLDPESAKLLGFLALAALQVELFRRDAIREEDRAFVAVYIDEMHFFADSAEGTWRELLSRGRRHGVGLVLASQHIGQLPRSLQREVSSCCSSLVVAGGVSAADAVGLRRELVIPSESGDLVPVPSEDLVASKVGEGFARLSTGACALRVKFAPPIDRPDAAWANRVRQASWRRFAAPPAPREPETTTPAAVTGAAMVPAPEPGRGSAPHKLIQRLAKEWGEARGFRATLEQDVLGGAGRVDVVLERNEIRVAIEVAVANSAAEVAESVVKDLAAGFTHVVVVSADTDLLRRAEERTVEAVLAKDRGKVRFLSPDALPAFLDEFRAGDPGTRAGYLVRVEGNPEVGRRRALARLVGAALLRRRRST